MRTKNRRNDPVKIILEYNSISISKLQEFFENFKKDRSVTNLSYTIIFTFLFISPDNTSLGQIIRGELDGHFITRQDTDEVHPEFTTDMCQYFVSILQLYLEGSVGEFLNYSSFDFNCICFRHFYSSIVRCITWTCLRFFFFGFSAVR